MNGDRLCGHEGRILCVNENDRWILTGGEDRTIRVWERSPQSELFHQEERLITNVLALGKHQSEVTAVRFTSSGRVVAVAGNRMHLWDLLTRKCLCIIEAHVENIREIHQLSTGHFMSAGGSELRIWNVEKKAMLLEIGPAPGVTICLECSDGSILTAGADPTIRRWSFMEDKNVEPVALLEGHKGNITSLLELHDGKVASTSEDTTVRIWEGDICIAIFDAHTGPVRSVIQNADGRLISAGEGDQIHIWEPTSPNPIFSLSCPSGVTKLLDCTSCGMFMSHSPDHVVRLWHLDSKEQKEEIEIESTKVTLLSDLSILAGSRRLWFPRLLVQTDNATALANLLHKPSLSIEKLSELYEVDDLSEMLLEKKKLRVARLVKSHKQNLESAVARVKSQFRPSGDVFPCSGALTKFIKFPKSLVFLHGDPWTQKPCVGFVFYDEIWAGLRKRTSPGVAHICIYNLDTVRNSPRYDSGRTLLANAVAHAFHFEPDPSSLIYGFTLKPLNTRIEFQDDDEHNAQFYFQTTMYDLNDEIKIGFPRVLRVQVEFFLHAYYAQGIKPDRRIPFSVVRATENSTCWQVYSSQLKHLNNLSMYSNTFGRVELFQGEEFGLQLEALEKENALLRDEIEALKQKRESYKPAPKAEYVRQAIKFPPGKLGMTFDLYSGKIVRVVEGGMAEQKSVKPGWILVLINNTPFSKERLLQMDFKVPNKLAFDVPQFIPSRRMSMGKRVPGTTGELFDADELIHNRIQQLENEVKIARRQSIDIMKQGIQIKNKLDSHEAVVESKVQELMDGGAKYASAEVPEQIIKDVKEVVETKHVNLEQDIEELQMENMKLRASIDILQQDNLDTKQKFALLRNQMEKRKTMPLSPPAEDMERKAEEVFRRESIDIHENLETIVKDGEALQEFVETNHTNVQEDIITLQLQNEHLRSLVQTTQQDSMQTKSQFQVLRTQLDKLREQQERLQKATRGMSLYEAMSPESGGSVSSEDMEALKTEIATVEEKQNSLQSSFELFESGIQEEVNTASGEIEELMKRVDMLDANLTMDVRRLSIDHTDVKSNSDRLTSEVKGTEQKTLNLRNQLQSSKEQQKAFEDQIKSVLFTLKRQVDKINETLERYDERESELEMFVQATQESQTMLRMDSNDLKGTIESIVNEVRSISPPVLDPPEPKDSLESKLQEKDDEIAKLCEENQKLASSMDQKIEERMMQFQEHFESRFAALSTSGPKSQVVAPQVGGADTDPEPGPADVDPLEAAEMQKTAETSD